jgi:hypothetical protein
MQLCHRFRFEPFFAVLYAICGDKSDEIQKSIEMPMQDIFDGKCW